MQPHRELNAARELRQEYSLQVTSDTGAGAEGRGSRHPAPNTQHLAPVFYGWWIVAASFVTIAVIYGFRYYVYGVFLKPMAADLGWDRGTLSSLYSVAEILEYAFGLLVGRAADRYGPRGLMLGGAVIAGASFGVLALVSSLWQFYLVYGLVMTLGVSMMGMVPITTAIANWFVRRRGTAMGLAFSAISVGAVVMVPVSAWIIEEFGWRVGWLVFAVMVFVLILPTAGLVMRRRPEDMGLKPDGAMQERQGAKSAPPDQGWTFADAVRTPAFWLLAIVSGLASAPLGTFAVHMAPFASDVGLTPIAAAAAVSLSSLIALPGRIFYGWLADRMDKRWVMILLQVGMAIGFAMLVMTRTPGMLYAAASVIGLFIGGIWPVPAAWIADLFGRRAIGAIFGLNTFIATVVFAIGPVATGYLYDASGGYTLGFATMIGCLAIGTALVCFIRRPQMHFVRNGVLQ